MNNLSKAVLTTVCLGASAAPACAIKIADGGEARAAIVVAADAPPDTRHAADELSSFLGQVTGGKFAIAHEAQPGKAALYVGEKAAKLADAAFSSDGLGEDGIVIRTVGDDLILAGGAPRGTLYAVYSFLEDYVGCRWWTPTESSIPRKPSLAFDNLNVRYVPALEYRDSNYADVSDADYSVRNKYNGHNHRLFINDGLSNVQQDAARGGRKYAFVRSDRWQAHGLWTLVPPPMYFQDHPEWYSLIDGKRTAEDVHHSSLCLTNVELQKKVVENSLLALWGNPHTTLLSLEQWDDSGPPDHCQCEVCAQVEKEEGSPAGIMIRFANAVQADFAKQADKFERKKPVPFTVLAYHYTQKPPLHAKPAPGIIVRMCPIRADYSVPLADDRNREFRDDFQGWAKITDSLFIWYYSINFGYMMLPYPNLDTIAPNFRYLAANNVKGLLTEANPAYKHGEMAALRSWLVAKLAWNPNLDDRALIREFTDGYYGPAGKDVRAYIETLHKASRDSGEKLGIDVPPSAKFLSFATLGKCLAHFRAAEAAVRNDPALLARVREAELPVTYAFIMKWDDLQKEAQAADAAWPIKESLAETRTNFIAEAVGRKGISMDFLRLPAAPQ